MQRNLTLRVVRTVAVNAVLVKDWLDGFVEGAHIRSDGGEIPNDKQQIANKS